MWKKSTELYKKINFFKIALLFIKIKILIQVDAMKFWLMWKARGTKGMQSFVDTAMIMANYFLEQIRNRQGFRLVQSEFECTNICFW